MSDVVSVELSSTSTGVRRVLYVSRSAPPGVSGSAHVLQGLLAADTGQRLVAAGAVSWWSRPSLRQRVYLFPTELSFFGRGARFFAPLRQLLRRRLARRIEALARQQGIERIVCVFPDALYCAASLDAARALGKPVDFYFHNTYADNREGMARRYADRLEASMVEQAGRLLFISQALMDRFVDKYPGIAGKSVVAPHPVPGLATVARPFRDGIVRATLMGNLNPSNSDAAGRLLRALSRHPAIDIRLCTPVPRMLLQARGMDLEGIRYLGYLPENEMTELLADTDLFLLPHGLAGGYSSHEYQTIFPTRAAHYLAQGRPILAHCPRDSGLERYLRRHDCAELVTEPDEAGIRQAFDRLLADTARQQLIAGNALAAAEGFRPGQVLRTVLAAGDEP